MKKVIIYRRGFTLLEVMIGLAIFAVAGIVALRTCLLATRHIQLINDEKNLLLLSRVKIEEFKTGIVDIETETNGVFPPPFEAYQWEIELTDITITDTEYGVVFTPYKLTVRTDNSEYSTLTGLLKYSEEGEQSANQ
ncbi:MAG: prepilin-type N-terminal cleavage/methylation domain-containing protein [Candidatus Ratteibacteria bacterium]|nr:prepilin-type N-terminal cleavage/methylation domain-containing protein [Candidatus Ratteibacteria bacterium]